LASENFGSGTTWTNPYRYDGRDGVRYDGETGLYWMSVRAYDPALGRFLSRDPLGRAPLFFSDQPYVYGGNNPLINVDPSGQFMATEGVSNKQAHAIMKRTYRLIPNRGKPPTKKKVSPTRCDSQCQADTDDGNTDIRVGIFKFIGSILLMAGACWIEFACIGWLRFMTPIFLSGIHDILDGIDLLHQISGSVGDAVSLLVRGARIAVDVMQVFLAVSNVMSLLSKIGAAINGLRGVATVVADGLAENPEAEENAFGALAGAIFGLSDFGKEVAKDLREFQETQTAYWESHS